MDLLVFFVLQSMTSLWFLDGFGQKKQSEDMTLASVKL